MLQLGYVFYLDLKAKVSLRSLTTTGANNAMKLSDFLAIQSGQTANDSSC